jgi:hypothetical protein
MRIIAEAAIIFRRRVELECCVTEMRPGRDPSDRRRQQAPPEEELVHPPTERRAATDERLHREAAPQPRRQKIRVGGFCSSSGCKMRRLKAAAGGM